MKRYQVRPSSVSGRSDVERFLNIHRIPHYVITDGNAWGDTVIAAVLDETLAEKMTELLNKEFSDA
jgi:hypothetical protein